MNLMKRIGISVVGCGLLATFGCYEVEKKPVKYEFDDFGYIGNVTLEEDPYVFNGITEMKLEDIDKDGDLDLIIGTDRGDIHIIENKFPQKKE